jgi:hypothetical protein
MKHKPPFAFLFTAVCLTIMILSIVILSLFALMHLRRLSPLYHGGAGFPGLYRHHHKTLAEPQGDTRHSRTGAG